MNTKKTKLAVYDAVTNKITITFTDTAAAETYFQLYVSISANGSIDDFDVIFTPKSDEIKNALLDMINSTQIQSRE
jgi:hypothetical protein